jgi:hypothetical protein
VRLNVYEPSSVPLPTVDAGAGDEVADDGAVDDPTGAGAAEDPALAAGVVTVLLAAAGGLLDVVDEEVLQPAANPTAVNAMVMLTTEASRAGTNPARRLASLFLDCLNDRYD